MRARTRNNNVILLIIVVVRLCYSFRPQNKTTHTRAEPKKKTKEKLAFHENDKCHGIGTPKQQKKKHTNSLELSDCCRAKESHRSKHESHKFFVRKHKLEIN